MPDDFQFEQPDGSPAARWLFTFRVDVRDAPRLIDVSLAIEQTLGYDAERLTDEQDPFVFIAPAECDRFAALLADPPARKTQESVRLEDASGGTVQSHQTIRPVEGEAGEVAALEGVAYPGPPERELPYEWIVSAINEGILVCRFSGEIVYVNRRMAEMLGYGPEEMTGRMLFDFMTDSWADRARENLERRKKGVEEIFDHQFVHSDGHPVWTMVATTPIPDHVRGLQGSLVAIRDISRRKRAEAKLQEARNELEDRVRKRTAQLREANEALHQEVHERRIAEEQARAASRAKSAFLANMSHEVRTPLNGVLGYTELIQTEIDAARNNDASIDLDQIDEDLDNVGQSAEHLLDLINDILDLSKAEAGKISVEFGPCNLEALLDEVVQTTRPTVEANDNELIVEYDGPEQLETDRTKLKQILINLVGNAGKFTEKGTVTVSVVSTTRQGRPAVRIAISDTGIGIEQEKLEELFEPFTRARPSTQSDPGGTGLGLTLARRYSRLLGGTLTVESEPGAGSTFTVILPISAPPEGETQRATDSS